MEDAFGKRDGRGSFAVTAAEPHGLWGLLQESFASGKMLAKAKMDTGSNPLIKAIVDDFATSEGRSTSRDGLKEQLTGKKAAEVKTACIEILGKVDGVAAREHDRSRLTSAFREDRSWAQPRSTVRRGTSK